MLKDPSVLRGPDGFWYVRTPMVVEKTPNHPELDSKYVPAYKTVEAACADLIALIPNQVSAGVVMPAKVLLNHRGSLRVRTGVRVAVPKGFKLCVAARSGLAERGLLVMNAPGQVDSDYRGEVCVLVVNVGRELIEIKDGDRIGQCWLEPVYRILPVLVDKLVDTERGSGGFGSTGQ